MPYLNADTIYYPDLRDKKYDAVKAKILKLYIDNLESKVYPHYIIYPNRR